MSLDVARKKENRISRRLTINTEEPYINIRPIIKKADKEAAYTLSEAYIDNKLLNWITGDIKNENHKYDIFQDIFKVFVRTAASESRECAIQINGCKGVLLWSEGRSQILSIGNVISKKRLWTALGALGTMRATLVHHRHLSKMKKQIMNGRIHVSINFIGVLPAERRRHMGTCLLKHVLKRSDEAQLPVFAEIWGQECLSWFMKFDFVVHASKNYSDKDDARVYYVVREPRTEAETPKIMSPTDAIAALHLEPPREDTQPLVRND